jgi:hypothetical protein
MFEPFPGNYVWNLATNLALYVGGNHGEIDAVCRPLREAGARGEDAGTAEFFEGWIKLADRVAANAESDLKKGRAFSAAAKLRRSSIYYQTGERMQARDYPPRREAYARALSTFQQSIALSRMPIERAEIPYETSSFPALFWKAESRDGRLAPAVVCCNGLDSTKELVIWTGIGRSLTARGISVLCVDQPGSGEALR